MPDTYLDSSLQTGFDTNGLLSLKLDTEDRLSKALYPELNLQNQTQPTPEDTEVQDVMSGKSDIHQASISKNPKVRDAANYILDKKLLEDDVYKGLGATKISSYNKENDKFLYGDFGYRPERDNENYYYENEYMNDNPVWRYTKNVGKFFGRVIPQAGLKLVEGLGYAGAMLTSVGSSNYWADVADNALSNYFLEAEENFKARVLPIYKQAGFDEKGFFSKLTDQAFWNESVADGVAFMASALVPGMAISKLGKIGAIAGELNAFGKAFSTTNYLGKIASGAGLGSGAEIASWTLNTAMEAAQEGAGVFKEMTKRMKEGRANGEPEYANLTDEDIRVRAGELAGNTVVGNFAVLGLSNAWENKLLFKALGRETAGAAKVALNADNYVTSKLIEQGKWAGRLNYYGKNAAKGIVAEGYWEENAQLAIQRMEQGDAGYKDDNGVFHKYDGFLGFWKQYGKQIGDATTGDDKEAAESIGLGALIGIGAGTVLSKVSGERTKEIENTRKAVVEGNEARQNLFRQNDIWKRDENGNIEFDKNVPVVDQSKLEAKEKAIKDISKKLGLAERPDLLTKRLDFTSKLAVADWVRSMNNIGIKNVSQRFSSLTPENAALFGINPAEVNEQAGKYIQLASKFEQQSKEVNDLPIGEIPDGLDIKNVSLTDRTRRTNIYTKRSQNIILSEFIADEQSELLKLTSSTKNLANTKLSDSIVERLDLLNWKILKNQQFIDNPTFSKYSEKEKSYHIDKDKKLREEHESLKKNNELLLEGIKTSKKGFYADDALDKNIASQVNLILSRVANFENVVDKNELTDSLFSDKKNGLINFTEWAKTSAEAEKAEQVRKSEKYKELQPGDFAKVTSLIEKIVFADDKTLTPEEVQLQTNYSQLIAEILPEYEDAAENYRSILLDRYVKGLKVENEKLEKLITEKNEEGVQVKGEIDVLIDELTNLKTKKRENKKRINEALSSLQPKLIAINNWLDEQTIKLNQQKTEIEEIEKVKDKRFTKLYDIYEEVKKDLKKAEDSISKLKQLIAKLFELIIGIKRDILGPVGSQSSINLDKYLNDLTEYKAEVEKVVNFNRAQIDVTLNKINADFKAKYIDLTKATPQKEDPEDAAIGAGYFGEFEEGENTIDEADENAGFDGSTYRRPLQNKFFTTTFPYVVYGTPTNEQQKLIDEGRALQWDKVPESDKDYFKFADFIATSPDVQKKLGKGKLKVLVVTRNNVKELGLEKIIDKDKFFNITEPNKAHFEMIPVIEEEDGNISYIDSDLNRLKKPSKKIVRTYLKLPYFTKAEVEAYLTGGKYKQPDLDLAIKSATDWREDILNQTTTKPQLILDFAVTRGIPNKHKMQDNQQAKNAAVGTVIPEIKPDSVVVYSGKSATVINGQNIEVPAGRPFIKSSNGVHEQLHAADNNIFEPEQVKSISFVLKEFMKDHISKVMEKVNSMKELEKFKDQIEKAGGIDKLDVNQKKQLFLAVTKLSKKKFKLTDSNFTTYLSGVLYYNSLAGKSPNKYQVHFSGPYMVFGTSGARVDMTKPEEIDNEPVQTFLSSTYHNVKYFSNEKAQNREFIEFYEKDGKLENRIWGNYSEYLLSDKFPDKSERKIIPVTTSVSTKDQHTTKNTQEPYYTYISRGISVSVLAPTITKSKPGKGENENDKGNTAFFSRLLGNNKEQPKGKVKIESDESFFGDEEEEKPVKPTGQRPNVKFDQEEDDEIGGLRVAQGGVFTTEKDLDEVINKVQKLLPQFPIVRLKQIIKTLDGQEAWGQFVNNVIKVYEGAEEGTLYHETFEAVANRILSDKEWNAIAKEFNSRTGYFTDRPTGKRLKYSEANAQETKEELAEEFRDYMLNGKIPIQPQTKSYFKIIWDFIKSFFKNVTSIQSVFESIEQGKFAKSSVRSSDRFFSNLRLKGINVEEAKNLFEHTTALMLKIVFNSPKSLSQFDSIEETDESLYEPIKEQFNARIAYINELIKKTTDERLKDKYKARIKAWEYVVGNWKDFVRYHKLELKKYRIQFEEEELEEQIENKTRNDYQKDNFKTDGKNSASKSIKFLFGTLLKVRTNKKGDSQIIDDQIFADISAIESSSYSYNLADYDYFMFKAMDQLSGLSDFSRVKEKMSELAGRDKLRRFYTNQNGNVVISNEKLLAETIAGMSREEATWTDLYNKVFGTSPFVDKKSSWKLKVKLHSYISKFAPTSWFSYEGGSVTSIIDATKAPYYEAIKRKINQGLVTNSVDVFVKNNKLERHEPNKKYASEQSFENFSKLTPENVKNKTLPVSIQELIDYLGLKDELTKELIYSLNDSDRGAIYNKLYTIRKHFFKTENEEIDGKIVKVPKSVVYGGKFNTVSMDIDGYVKNLITEMDKHLNLQEKSSQLQGVNGEMRQIYITPSSTSRLFSEINNVNTIFELYNKYPHLRNVFSRNITVISRIFDMDEKSPTYGVKKIASDISLDYVGGIKTAEERVGTTTAKLELHDRYYQQFIASLQGLYFSLPADSETEWVFNFGEYETFTENMLALKGEKIIKEHFLPKLKNEIDLIITNNSELTELSQKHPSNKTEGIANTSKGTSLRFFKDMLPTVGRTNPVEKIYELIDAGETSDKIISKLNKKLIESLLLYLNQQVQNTSEFMKEQKLVQIDAGNYIMRGLNNDFLTTYRKSFNVDQGIITLNKSQYTSLLEYQKINSILGSMESFQLVFGDPAQYKDWEKRARSLFSPFEEVFYDDKNELNTYLNEDMNTVSFEDKSVSIPKGDIFNTEFSDSINSQTIEDIEVIDHDVLNSLQSIIENGTSEEKEEAEKLLPAYGLKKDKPAITETDGQSIGTLEFGRHLLIKSGWRWTDEMEAFYQYDTALMRRDMSKNDGYKYPKGLKDIDDKLINYYETNEEGKKLITKAKITPIKPLTPSHTENGDQVLLKNSIYFISYQLSKGTELYDLYKKMLNDKTQIINFRSAQKVGNHKDKNGNVTNYYSDPYTRTDMSQNGVGTPIQKIDIRKMGIQVETQSSDWGQTLGSQLTKLIYLALSENGVPVDYKIPGASKSEIIQSWRSLSEEEKLDASDKYRKIQNSVNSLRNLKLKNTIDKFTELGISWTFDNNYFEFKAEDLTKLYKYIDNELRRLDATYNSTEILKLKEDLKSFENTAETTPNYEKISNLLWSMVDKTVTHMKVNGKSLVQVSSVFFNKGTRRAAFKDKETGRWFEINSKEEYDIAVANGNNPVMTSSELKFYTLGSDKINAMEILIPDIYSEKVNAKRKQMGLKELSEDEMLKYLNENPKLLEGIGFRIPTQATSSIEFFKIKGLLPKAFGSAIVVPSAITTKTGGDFDVDKLNTYLNNWKFGKDGMPVYEDFQDDSNSTSKERYVTYIKSVEKQYRNIYKDMQESSEYLEDVQPVEDEISEQRIVKNKAKETADEIYYRGGDIFRELPLSVRQQYYKANDILNIDEITGAERTLELLHFTEKWIKKFQGDKNGIVLEVTYRDGTTDNDTVNADEVLPVFNRLAQNYKDFLEANGIKEKEIKEFNELKEVGNIVRGEFNFKLSELIAETNGFIEHKIFKKLPYTLQNKKSAVENRYFQSIRDILEQKDMYLHLLSPNSADNIVAMRDIVYKALGITHEDKKELNYSNFTSTEFIANKRNQFIKGKYDVAISASTMTSYANSSVVGLTIAKEGGIKSEDVEVFEQFNQGNFELPFEDVEVLKVNDTYTITLSKLIDKTGKYIMDKLSGYVNGFVDVAKDPAIVEMGVHSELAGSYLLMERMGIRSSTIALFMYQPVIRQYLKAILLTDNKSFYGANEGLTSRGKVNKHFSLTYQPDKFKYDPEYKFTDEQLVDLIKKGERMKKDPNLKFTKEEQEAQWYALINYMKIRMYSSYVVENGQASNHDTAGIRNSETLLKKEIGREIAEGTNMVVLLQDEKVIPGVQALLENTSVGMDVNMLNSFGKLFKDIGLFSLEKDNPKKAMDKIARKILTQNRFISQDDFISIMREWKASILDLLISQITIRYTDKEGNIRQGGQLHNYYNNFFKTGVKDKQGILTGIKGKFEDLKSRYPKVFVGNYFLANLEILTDSNLKVDLMQLTDKPKSNEILKQEKYTDALITLSNYNPVNYPGHEKFATEMAELYRMILYGAFMQFGMKYSRNSFLHLIPVEDAAITMTDITNTALEDIDDADFTNLYEEVLRSKWYKDGMVKEKMFTYLSVLERTEKGFKINKRLKTAAGVPLSNNQKKAGVKLKAKKTNQIFLNKIIETGEVDEKGNAIKNVVIDIRPIFVFAGYEETGETAWELADDYIKVPMVKPEFTRLVIDGFSTYWDVKRSVYKMINNKDHSYMFTQLFKKVGLENKNLAKKYVGDKNNGKTSVSYMYKPIVSMGGPNFGEIAPLERDENDEVYLKKSVVDKPLFTENTDTEIDNMLHDSPSVRNVFEPEEVIGDVVPLIVPKPLSRKDTTPEKDQRIPTVKMKESAANKITLGTKTVVIRNEAQAKAINIPAGKTEKRYVAGDLYSFTNKGLLTIKEAGGLKKMLETQGIEAGDQPQDIKNWIEDKEKMVVYEITPADDLDC